MRHRCAALCPFCIQFAREQLADLFKTGLADIVELELIPSGNARMSGDGGAGEIECQHGPKECALNRALACATALAPAQADWFPFLVCVGDEAQKVERDDLEPEAVARKCAPRAGITADRLLACADGEGACTRGGRGRGGARC